jgi:hypothetical protein
MNSPEPASHQSDVLLSKLARLGRFIVFLCTAGWLFPHASTEGMDLTQIQQDRIAGKP